MFGVTESVSADFYDFLYISSIMQGEYIGQGATVCGLSHAVNKMRKDNLIGTLNLIEHMRRGGRRGCWKESWNRQKEA